MAECKQSPTPGSAEEGDGLPFPVLVGPQPLSDFVRMLVMHLKGHSSEHQAERVANSEKDPSLWLGNAEPPILLDI